MGLIYTAGSVKWSREMSSNVWDVQNRKRKYSNKVIRIVLEDKDVGGVNYDFIGDTDLEDANSESEWDNVMDEYEGTRPYL